MNVCMHHLSKHEPEAHAEIERLNTENGELKARVDDRDAELRIAWSDEDDPLVAENIELKAALEKARNQINYQCDRKLDAVQVASKMRTTMDAATGKLHTLEAAVRAVRGDGGVKASRRSRLVRLYALVTEVKS